MFRNENDAVGFYLDEQNKLNYRPTNADDIVQESAGYLYYSKTPQGETKVVIFSGINNKNGETEYEYANFGKSDYGMINVKAAPEVKLQDTKNFLEKVAKDGAESSAATALREATEETDNVITAKPLNQDVCEIITSEHNCWCAEGTKAKTKITVYPYEVTEIQLEMLQAKKFSQFTGISLADLKMVDGNPQFIIDGIDILDKANMGKLRGFNATLIKFYAKDMLAMFSDIIAAKSVYGHNEKSFAGTQLSVFAPPVQSNNDVVSLNIEARKNFC